MVTTKEVKIIKRLPTCIVCGEAASERCGNCTDFASNYCSREHQRLNWRIHKRLCTVATNKFIRQPDLLRSESDFFSEIASLCGCGKPHGNLLSVLGKRDENHKSLRATNDEVSFYDNFLFHTVKNKYLNLNLTLLEPLNPFLGSFCRKN